MNSPSRESLEQRWMEDRRTNRFEEDGLTFIPSHILRLGWDVKQSIQEKSQDITFEKEDLKAIGRVVSNFTQFGTTSCNAELYLVEVPSALELTQMIFRGEPFTLKSKGQVEDLNGVFSGVYAWIPLSDATTAKVKLLLFAKEPTVGEVVRRIDSISASFGLPNDLADDLRKSQIRVTKAGRGQRTEEA